MAWGLRLQVMVPCDICHTQVGPLCCCELSVTGLANVLGPRARNKGPGNSRPCVQTSVASHGLKLKLHCSASRAGRSPAYTRAE